jgi:hypothetical protein
LPTNALLSGNLCQRGTLGIVQIVIEGRDLPGRTFASYGDVHVALQVRSVPEGAVPGDAATARWSTEVRVADGDLRGPAVHGRRGERFLYLTWGSPVGDDWGMFRRAKLMLDRVDPALVAAAGDVLVATVSLTDDRGGPRCARVDPPAIRWSVP